MDETTTTDVPQNDSSEVTSQLETAAAESAEVSTQEPQTDPQGTDESVTTEADEDVEWLKNKGIDPGSESALKATAKLARDAEREFHKSRQEAKTPALQEQALQAIEPDEFDPTAARLQAVETRLAVTDFYSNNPEAKALDAEMASLVQSKPYLAQDLDSLYKLAKADKYEADIKAAESKGRDAAKAEIARAGAATQPQGMASAPTAQEEEDPFLTGWNA